MYIWFLTLLFILPFYVGSKAAACDTKDFFVVEKCYDDTLFSPTGFSTNSSELRNEMIEFVEDPNELANICQAKNALIKCLNDNDTTIIDRCFDVNSAQFFPFGGTDKDKGRRYMTNFYQLAYICDPKNSWAIPKIDCIIKATEACKFLELDDCKQTSDYLTCVNRTTNAYCNIAMACYAQKFATFQSCYDFNDCENCNSLSPTVNKIIDLCDNDTIANNIDNTTIILPACSSNIHQISFVFVPFVLAFFTAYILN